jgi:transcriptional regulator with XRE-family HTH domain
MAIKPNHELIYRRVPEYLRSLREKAGITQRELARKIKKKQYFIARCETGSRRVDIAEFVEWCIACQMDPKNALDELVARR